MSHDQAIFTSPVPRALCDAIISNILEHEGCEVLLSGADTSYFTGDCREYADFITYTMKNTVTVVDDLFSVDRDILKIRRLSTMAVLQSLFPHLQNAGATV